MFPGSDLFEVSRVCLRGLRCTWFVEFHNRRVVATHGCNYCHPEECFHPPPSRLLLHSIDLDAVVEETYNEAMRLYEYYDRMNNEIAKQEQEEAARAREAEGLPVVLDAELADGEEVRAFLSPLLLGWF